MTYWHMQLHPTGEEDNYDAGVIVKEMELIGMGYWEKGEPQLKQFQDEMNIGDIVLVRKGSIAKALVEVVGNFEDVKDNAYKSLDWFQFRRKIKILAFADDDMPSFPQPRGTLQKSINKYTRTYQYIDNWYKRVLNPTLKEKDMGLKIKNVAIADYKMFHNFHIDFLDQNKKILPIIVIAGKNGTGKTTLLESIKNRENASIHFNLDGKTIHHGSNSYEMLFEENIIYLDAMIENDNEIEKLILDYIDYFIYDKNKNAVVGAENLQKDMDEIFEGFDLNFYFKKIDYKTKKPVFGNEDNVRDDIDFSLKALSTGERTLLSKLLFLHLKEPKNKVILIDEPETSLHPSWQNKILKFYENFAEINNNQIIIATHSPNIIGSAKNEFLRILRKNEEGNIEVIDDLKAHGRDINSILFDVMGEVAYRPREFDDKIDKLYMAIDDKKFKEAKEELTELKKDYGEKDTVVQEAEMLIDVLSSEE